MPGTAHGASRPLVIVRGAHRRFGGRTALAGADLTAWAREILVLLGPNGAGKSTLLRALCGRTRLDSGSVLLDGGSPAERATRRRIGFVPQSIALWPRLSVRTNLATFGRLAGLRRDEVEPAVADALAWSGLASRARDPVGALSGGMQRRINIAAGTLHHPDLLLLDEPTVGLDPVARDEVHKVLLGLRDRGMGLILTTHDLIEAESLADRVAVLAAGVVRAADTIPMLVGRLFGRDQEILLMLAREPAPELRDYLRSAHLSPTNEPRLWVGRLQGDLERLPGLRAGLIDAGADIAELRVRQPGLHGVFVELTGQVPRE
ncbi:MAG: ABC transporter ATP-binding protein [Gammaproteobacteria bacterium]|nr:ABC transporter ATP-binding protein [Gammaproteobacteria bacterium]